MLVVVLVVVLLRAGPYPKAARSQPRIQPPYEQGANAARRGRRNPAPAVAAVRLQE